ncbi:MAG: hypothetical protein E5W09_20710 [Mesorhizobium sp.]|nr:hypothetical protein EOA86_15335 [Mesorhizobium sp. M5C.F.Ca.IN.020.32.2.1]RWI46066.1 MAG: hypothetical protein EOR16_35800 [Mesorhizobium sp.]RWP09576.1 MAG: hypothetical protein EOR00_32380 [Mesorhizobium sp.]TIU95464.1 MAG: hypothetical protein E5W09_20710 [Mesorhizobium sp.]TJV30336.1 MAG: hypothetical protein E5X87_27840 [Mesorhizobium sp.]
MRIVEETYAPGVTVSLVARQHGIAQTSSSHGAGSRHRAR